MATTCTPYITVTLNPREDAAGLHFSLCGELPCDDIYYQLFAPIHVTVCFSETPPAKFRLSGARSTEDYFLETDETDRIPIVLIMVD